MKVGLGRVWGLRSIAGGQSYAERRSGSALDHAKRFSYWRFMRIDLMEIKAMHSIVYCI